MFISFHEYPDNNKKCSPLNSWVKPVLQLMIHLNTLRFLKPALFLLPMIILNSCEKFSGSQAIPAYMAINSINLTTNYSTQGSASQAITDAWVFVDGESIGTFQMPAHFPVLKEGSHTLTIMPGIKKDGIAATRVVYDFYSPLTKTVNFVSDSTISLGTLSTSYQSTTKFLWKEDFEDVALTLDTSNRSTVNLVHTAAGSPLVFEGSYSGMATMTADTDFFECTTHKEYDIPFNPVYLEMNFRSNNTILVGVIVYFDLLIYQVPIITLFPTNEGWKKIYIDLTTTLHSYSGAKKFKVILNTYKDKGVSPAVILLDNFKLVSR